MSLALLFAAPVFAGGRIERAIRWLFVGGFVLAVAALVGFWIVGGDLIAFEVAVLSINWIVLIASGVLLGVGALPACAAEYRGGADSRAGGASDVIHIKGDILIDRPVEDVFDYVADECNEPSYNAQMRLAEKISDGPIGVGTQYRAEVVSGGRPVSMVIEFTAYERPRRLASKTTMSAMDIAYTLTFEPVREGTRMGWSRGRSSRTACSS